MKSPIEPGNTNLFYAKTKGYKKLGKLMFYGSFGYSNEQYKDLLYNNTLIFDINNPYILGDTIGGKQRKEGFLLKGSVAIPLTDKITVGIDADYQDYVGAKGKDPRNRNDISSLAITPGIIFNGTKLSVGLSGGPVVFNNDISVSVMDDGRYNLFQFLGFGYFKSIRNIISYENEYFGKGYQAEAQLRYINGNYSNFLVIDYNSGKEEVRYGTTKRLIDGISDKNCISVSNYQSFRKNGNLHRLNTIINMMRLNGTEVMQHSKTIITGSYSYDTLITDSWIQDKHIASNYDGTIEYIFSRYNDYGEKSRINLGMYAEYQTAYHYPVRNYGFQEVINIMAFTGYKKYISIRSVTLIPEFGIGYRKNLFKDMNYVIAELSLPAVQQQDYLARHSDFFKGNAGISFMKKTGMKAFNEYYININTAYTYAPDKLNGPYQNFLLNCSMGLIF